MVEPHNENDAVAKQVAEQLSTALERIAELRKENARLVSLVPPKSPARLLGPGCVRMRDGLWLLNQREKGWTSWGVRLDGWDDLFRRYAVTVTAHGEDEHGLWWEVTP